MGKYGNFGGMPGGMNMKDMMKQAQKMQEQMKAQAAELEKKEFTAAAGGGAVNVKVSGKKELLELKIDRDAVDPEDVEMLEDMIRAAVNEALKKVDAESANLLGKFM